MTQTCKAQSGERDDYDAHHDGLSRLVEEARVEREVALRAAPVQLDAVEALVERGVDVAWWGGGRREGAVRDRA